jgi:hypothetical protein
VQGSKQLMGFAKEFTQSDAFKDDYNKWRTAKLNPDQKTKGGISKLAKIINNKIGNSIDKSENEKNYSLLIRRYW